MKFFYKLFLCTVTILTISLTTMSCIAVSLSLKSAVHQEMDSAMTQHQLLEYAIECSIIEAGGTEKATEEDLANITEQSAQLLSANEKYALINQDGAILSGIDPQEKTDKRASTSELTCHIREQGNRHELVVCGSFSQNSKELTLYTLRDISSVFKNAENLLRQQQYIFLAVMCVSFFAIFLMSWLLTRPIQSLRNVASAFANGDYSSRAICTTRDEFYELACTYNQMADSLEQKIADLERSVREKEAFSANFAHELKTPMTSIIGYADTIYQKTLPPEELRKAAGYIVNEGMRLEALSFKLMDLITLNREDFLLEETELVPFFEDMRESILLTAEKRGIAFSMDCEAGWARMELDLFKTLMLNLLDNAMKSGGTKVTLAGKCQKGFYHVTIADNGRGIPPDELERITEAFYMVDKSRSRKEHGAGLGLALAKRIAELHHTSLNYESEMGVGTSVTLALKLEEQDET